MEVRKRYNDYVNSGGEVKGPYGHIIAPEVQGARGEAGCGRPAGGQDAELEERDMSIRWLALLATLPLGGCYGLAGNDEMDRYFQRSETITHECRRRQQVNAVTHTINPWPAYVGDRVIVSDARRVGAAVTRYGNTQRPIDQLPDIGDATKAIGQAPPTNQNVNISGGGAAGVSVPVGGGR